jgi:membrane dipeptidase
MKKVLTGIAILVLLLSVVFLAGPGLAESRFNKVRPNEMRVSQKAAALHRTLFIADLHADTLLWGRDLLRESSRGHVDVPRLIRGNVAIQAFTVVTKAPRGINMVRNADTSDLVLPLILLERWPPATWTSLKARALYQAARLAKAASASQGKLVWIKTAADLSAYEEHRRHDPAITAGFLGIEGAHALDGNLASLGDLYDAGFRMMSPTHFTDNSFAGSSTGARKGGLTAAGRALVKAMEARHVIIDLAHASSRTVDNVLAIATRPVLVSHTGVKAVCNSNRNLSDDQISRIAAAGGLIGIAYFQAAVCGKDARAVARAIWHAAGVAGADHIALGSDFDGGTPMPFDASELTQVTEALLASGFSDAEVSKIMGGNARRFLESNLP